MLDRIRGWLNISDPLASETCGPIQLVVIQPTTYCNLDCDYCYLPNREFRHKFTLDLLEPIFRKIFESRLLKDKFTVVWHAGEPLTLPTGFYESTIETIEQLNNQFNLKPYNICHDIQTNGTLINQAWCNTIKKYNIRIGVSLDGPAFIHDEHRQTRKGTGSHASTMRGISFLQKNEINFGIISVLTDKSLDFPEEIISFFLEHDIRSVGFNIEEVEGVNLKSSLNHARGEERYRQFMKRIYELARESGQIRIREFDQIRNAILHERKQTKGQFTPFTMLNISYNGDFSTYSPELLSMSSSTYGDFILGNINHDDLLTVQKTEKFRRIYDDIRAGVRLCEKKCQYFSLCGGGAPSNKYFENGSFRSSETAYCRYTKKVLIDIVLEELEESLGLHG